MDAHDPIPPRLQTRIHDLQHDFEKARANLAAGRIPPESFGKLGRILAARLEAIEAEVSARLLLEARASKLRGLN